MTTVHPLLHAASALADAAEKALNRLIKELEAFPKKFLSTVAINFWSPYLPSGRHTGLKYPKADTGKSLADEKGGEAALKLVLHRYLTLLGRNLSINHLLVEVPNVKVKQIIVDGTKDKLDGPLATGGKPGSPIRLTLRIPLRSGAHKGDASLNCFHTLVPEGNCEKWVGWLNHEDYECLWQGLLREELLERRLAARRELPPAFADHLYSWLKEQWVLPHVGLGDFDDRWLARIQLTAIASAIWGEVWVSDALSLGDGVQNRLGLRASCTVTGQAPKHAVKNAEKDRLFVEEVRKFGAYCSKRLKVLLMEQIREEAAVVADLDHEPWGPAIATIGNKFSHELGGSLIGADHEGKPVSLRGILTPGLDSLQVGPTEVMVLHDIAEAEFGPLGHPQQWWDVWKAYFVSNDLFLARDRVALHFELALTKDRMSILPVPRHVVQVARSIYDLFELLKNSPAGLLQVGFQADEAKVLHIRSFLDDEPITIKQIAETKMEYQAAKEKKGDPFDWSRERPAQSDWGKIRDKLYRALRLIKQNLKDDAFFKNAAASLYTLREGQLLQLADGITEVRRLGRGCLLFIGPVYRRSRGDTYWFLNQSGNRRAEITRLGLALDIVSQIPNTPSETFRRRFADAAGMDGETIVFGADKAFPRKINGYNMAQPASRIETGRFVHLPLGTPALLDLTKPMVSAAYAEAWDSACRSLNADALPSDPEIICRTVSGLGRSELLSLGTRHRKAAMTTRCIDSILALTCSASGKIRVWIGGIPVFELAPQVDHLLPSFSHIKGAPRE